MKENENINETERKEIEQSSTNLKNRKLNHKKVWDSFVDSFYKQGLLTESECALMKSGTQARPIF